MSSDYGLLTDQLSIKRNMKVQKDKNTQAPGALTIGSKQSLSKIPEVIFKLLKYLIL